MGRAGNRRQEKSNRVNEKISQAEFRRVNEKISQAELRRVNSREVIGDINAIEFAGFHLIDTIPQLAAVAAHNGDLSFGKWVFIIPFHSTTTSNLGAVVYTKDFEERGIIAFENVSLETLFGVSKDQLFDQAHIYRRQLFKQKLREELGWTEDSRIMLASELKELREKLGLPEGCPIMSIVRSDKKNE